MTSNLFLFAGEHSGDVYGGKLLEALNHKFPSLKATGVGGPLMRAQGLDCLMPMEDFQVMGFVDIVRKFPSLYKQFYTLRDHILETKPDVTILIDYPGFNLRLAKALRKKGYQGKLVHYVCPTVWAWGKGRIKTLSENLDLLLTIFPFEPPLFTSTGLKTIFVGHPLIEKMQQHQYDANWKYKIEMPAQGNVIALFPGSRAGEVTRLLKRQLQAAMKLRQEDPEIVIGISCTDASLKTLITKIAQECDVKIGTDAFLVPREYTYDLMKDCRTAIAKSGTINLELALHHKPTVVVYEISTINYLILWYVVRLHLDYYSIVNILCNRTVYPELISDPFTAEQLYETLLPLHRDGQERETCIEGCKEAEHSLLTSETQRASYNAASAIQAVCV